jgi:SNF2 family DNA or RNA helicase
MRSGAVGIKLTAANHVFILEPCMNPALEDQAVGRAFRMGQSRPVTVKKLFIKVPAACVEAKSVYGAQHGKS